MSSNLIINVRCTCEEEFLLLHKLHKLYQEDQLRKRLKDRLLSVQGNGDGTESYTVKCEEPSNTFDEKPSQPEKHEITLTDVLEAEALEKAEAEDEGWNGEDRNFCA